LSLYKLFIKKYCVSGSSEDISVLNFVVSSYIFE